MMKRLLLIAFCFAFYLVCLPAPAYACFAYRQFDIEHVRKADAVFVAHVRAYEKIGHYGLYTVMVYEALKGDPPNSLQLVFHNSTFGVPDGVGAVEERSVIFAAVNPVQTPTSGREQSHWYRPAYGRGAPLPAMEILQEPCSSAFIMPNRPDTITALRKVLAGGAPPADFDWFDSKRRAAEQKLRQEAARLEELETLRKENSALNSEITGMEDQLTQVQRERRLERYGFGGLLLIAAAGGLWLRRRKS